MSEIANYKPKKICMIRRDMGKQHIEDYTLYMRCIELLWRAT